MKNKKRLLVDDAENNIQNWVDEESDEITDSQADPQEQFLNPLPKKKQKKVEKETKSVEDPNWNEEITLIPEEYDELDDGSGFFIEFFNHDTYVIIYCHIIEIFACYSYIIVHWVRCHCK